MICLVKWVPQSLEIVEGALQVGRKHVFQKFICPCGSVSLLGEKGFAPPGKHTYNNKDILVTHATWQLNEVQLQVSKGSRRRRFEASGNKSSFSRIMNLADKTLVVNCFCKYICLTNNIYV